MKWVSPILIAVLAAVALLVPEASSPEPDPAPGAEEPQFAVCVVDEGSGRTTEAVVSSMTPGPVQLTLFASGDRAGSLSTEVDGSVVIPVVDIAAVGSVGALVELPSSSSAASVIIGGAESLVVDTCQSETPAVSYVGGGSTAREQSFVLQLMNPFAGDAVVRLRVASENGLESSDVFESVIVPPHSSSFVDFGELIPGRESISVRIDTIEGRVIGGAWQTVDGDTARWSAVEPATDWFVPVPVGNGAKEIRIGNASDTDIEYQIDLYGVTGLEEQYVIAPIPAGGEAVFDIAAIGPETMGVRVIATDPVVPTLRLDSDLGFGVSVGSRAPGATQWLLPGAGAPEGGWATMTVLNPSLEDATVTVDDVDGVTRTLSVPADGLLELALLASSGHIVESSVEVVISWSMYGAGVSALVTGFPLADG